MFQFIKNLFRPSHRMKDVKVPVVEAKLITKDLLLASFIHLLTTYASKKYFAKNYQCVAKFINLCEVPVEENPLDFDGLVNLDTFENKECLRRSGIIKFAKRYKFLCCKCPGNPRFDSWMEKLATINTSY